MAQPKIDDREVRKIRAAIARDGVTKASSRFDEHSPEWHKAQQERATRRAVGAKQRALHEIEPPTKEGTTMQNTKPTPAQERSAQQSRSDAQAKVAAMKRQQAQQNARIKDRASSQGQGMGM